jgi:hypothetical protein
MEVMKVSELIEALMKYPPDAVVGYEDRGDWGGYCRADELEVKHVSGDNGEYQDYKDGDERRTYKKHGDEGVYELFDEFIDLVVIS